MSVKNAGPIAHYRHLSFGQRVVRDWKLNKWKYLLIIPVLVYLALFCYKPMYGLVIAFKNYKPTRGIERSAWMDPWYAWFEKFFTDPYFGRLIGNTFTISILTIVFGFPAPILLALLLNEINHNKFKRTVQTITYMPYFISMVVTCALIRVYCQQDGLLSDIVVFFGGQRQNWLMNSGNYRTIYIISEPGGPVQHRPGAVRSRPHRRREPLPAVPAHHPARPHAHHHHPVYSAHGQHPERGL